MFKNGGLMLRKKDTIPNGVDKDCVIIFLNDNKELCYVDFDGYTSKLSQNHEFTSIVDQKYDASNIPSNYDELMVSTNTFFGDGCDGDKEVDEVLVLDRDYYFKSLKLNKNGIINSNGYRIFVQDVLTFNGGIIQNNGNKPESTKLFNIGAMGGVATNLGSLGQGGPGMRGSKGGICQGDGTSATVLSFPLSNGGAGGCGGDGGNGKGLGGKATSTSTINKYIVRNVYLALQASRGPHLVNGGLGGGSGGGGGGNLNNFGGAGGAGGGGGGVIQVVAKTIVITPNASYPSICANGGDGLDGSDSLNEGCGAGGGGSGGGGGYIQLFYLNIPSEINEGFISAIGGKAGNGGKTKGDALDGKDGSNGKPGNIECACVKNGKWNTFVGMSNAAWYK